MKMKQLIIALAIFLYWKCPAENAGNGISEPLNLKNFPGEHAPQTPLVSSTFGGATFLSARTTSKPRATPLYILCQIVKGHSPSSNEEGKLSSRVHVLT